MKVLIATEGSEFSKSAVRGFCDMFRNVEGIEVKIISVVEPAVMPTEPFAMSPELVQQIDVAAERKAAAYAEEAAALIGRELRIAGGPETKVVMGIPAAALVKEAEEWKADLIVTGSHGHGFWKRAWLGSVSDAVVHHAPCSVLIVRQDGAHLS